MNNLVENPSIFGVKKILRIHLHVEITDKILAKLIYSILLFFLYFLINIIY